MRKVPTAKRDKTLQEAASLVQIETFLDHKPSQLSGGQRQRVAISRVQECNMAKVFHFPVSYETMTVYDNPAFLLRNRSMPEDDVDRKRST